MGGPQDDAVASSVSDAAVSPRVSHGASSVSDASVTPRVSHGAVASSVSDGSVPWRPASEEGTAAVIELKDSSWRGGAKEVPWKGKVEETSWKSEVKEFLWRGEVKESSAKEASASPARRRLPECEEAATISGVSWKPPRPLHISGGTGVRAILQFVVITSHHSRLLYIDRREAGRMCVFAFFILSGLVSAMAGTEIGGKDKGRPPKWWLRKSICRWLRDCVMYAFNLVARRVIPLLAIGGAMTAYYPLIKTQPAPKNPRWDFVTGAWGFKKHFWWRVTPNGWYISALIWFLMILPAFLIVLRGLFRSKLVRSLLVIPGLAFCYYQVTRQLWATYALTFSPYPYIGWMAVSYSLGSLATDHYYTLQKILRWKQRNLWGRFLVDAAALGSLIYAAVPPKTRGASGSNQLFFYFISLFEPFVGRLLDCRWFCCVAGGTIPLLAYLLHGMIGLHVLGYVHARANNHVWFLYLATWLLSLAFEQYLMVPVVRITKKYFAV